VCKDCEFSLEYVLNHRLEALENDKEFLGEDSRTNPRLCKNLLAFEVQQLQKKNGHPITQAFLQMGCCSQVLGLWLASCESAN